MKFSNRIEAGKLLTDKLRKYVPDDIVVYALPRGGLPVALEIARYLHAPLDLILTRKIGIPHNPEQAIAAIAENGHIIGNRPELLSVDQGWLEEEIEKQRQEIKRRRSRYLHGRIIANPMNKTIILVDDGVATGLTLHLSILEIKKFKPRRIIVAVPVIPLSTALLIQQEVDELVTLHMPSDDTFLGAVGAYYEDFRQIEDREVIKILDTHELWLMKEKLRNVQP